MRNIIKNIRPPIIFLAGITIVFAVLELTPYGQSNALFFYLMLYTAAGVGFNLMYGYTGYLPFGNIGFYTVGQYVTGMSFFLYGIHPVAGILLSIVVGIPFALLLYPTLRLKGIYFAIASYLISGGIIAVIESLPYSMTGGATGISLVPVYSPVSAYYMMLTIMVIGLVLTYIVEFSKVGLALRAIKENTSVSEMLGIRPTRYKLMAWLGNASLVAACGSISAWYSAYVSFDTAVSPLVSLNIVFFPILGGPGTIFGPLVGALLYVPLGMLGPIYVSDFTLVYGIMIALIILLLPTGLLPRIRRLSPILQEVFR